MQRYVSVSALKHYFQVSNSYVINKLFLVLFPWRHKPWTRKQTSGPNGQEGWYLAPRDDINSPDMYIPVMAVVTYVLLSTMIAGIRGQFQPDLLGNTAITASIIIFLEILVLKLGCYLLGITNNSQLLELIAYSGYKFVGAIVTTAIAETVSGGKGTGGWVGWFVFFFTWNANAFFLVSRRLSLSLSLCFLLSDSTCLPPRFSSFGHSSTFCCQKQQAMAEGRCRLP